MMGGTMYSTIMEKTNLKTSVTERITKKTKLK